MPGSSAPEGTGQPGGVFNRFKLWKEYEGVAMHFNDLIIKLRSQSLGAVAVFATLATVVVKGDTRGDLRWGLLAGAFFLLAVFWVAVWILDLGYYNRLLQGAVDALIAIESKSAGSEFVDEIELSTLIEARVKKGCVENNACRRAFYIIVFVSLVLGLAFSAWRFASAEGWLKGEHSKTAVKSARSSGIERTLEIRAVPS